MRGVRRSRVRQRAAALAVAASLAALAAACGGDDGDEDAACTDLAEYVQVPEDLRPVLDGIVGPAPRLVDVLLRPWSYGDVATQLVAFLHPDAAPDAATVAEELSPALDVSEVLGPERARRQLELLVGSEAAAAEEPTAVLRVIAIGRAEVERSMATAQADPRVRAVVSEADAGPYWGRFADAGYQAVADRLDAVEEVADPELAEMVAELRRHASEVARSARPDLADFEVPEATRDLVEELALHLQEGCDLYVEDA